MPEDTYYLQMEIQLTTAADKVLKEMGELLTTVTDQLKNIQKATEDFSKNASKDLTITNEQFKQLKKINQEISDQQDEYQKIKTAFDKDQKGVREDAIKFSEKTLGTVDRLQESYQGLGKDLDNIAGKYAESAKSSIDSYRQQEAAIASYKSGVEKGGETISTAMSDAAKSANGISQSSAEATESISGIGGDTTGLQKFAKALGLVSGDIGSLGKDTPGLNIFGKVLKSVGIDIGSLGKDTPGLNIFGKVLKSVGIDIGSLGKNASGLNTFDKNVKDTSDNIRSLGKDTPGLGVFSKVLKAVGIDVSGFTKQTGAAGESAAGITGGAEEAQEVMGGLGKTAGVAGAALLTLVTGGAAAPALLGAIGAGGGAAATGAAAAAGAAGKAGAAMGGMGAAAGRAAGAGGLGKISDWFGGIGKIINIGMLKFSWFFQALDKGFTLIAERAENFRMAMYRATGSMNDMAFQATKLETGIIGSSKEIDEMIGSLAQAGAKGEELYNITKTTTVLNRAMGTSAAISAKFMMNVTRISGSSKQAAAMMGLKHNAAAKFGLSGKDMDEVMQHIVTSARQLALYGPNAVKKYTEGILAAVAAAKELGMETSKALEIMDKTKDPTGYAGLFGGKTFLMSAEQKQKELIKMGPELAERMKNLKSEAEKNRFMVEMGARMDINPREVPDAIALLQKAAEKEKIMIKTGLNVKEAQKQIDDIVKKAQDASTGVVTLAKTIMQRIYSTFMMIVAPLLNIMKPILTFFLGLVDLVQALVAPIAEALSEFTGFLDISEEMTDVFKSLMVPISFIGKTLAVILRMFLMPIVLAAKTIKGIFWAIGLVLKPIFAIFCSIGSMIAGWVKTLAGWFGTVAGWFGISMDEGAKKQEEAASSAVQSQQEYADESKKIRGESMRDATKQQQQYADESEKIREKSIRDAAKQQQQNMKYIDDNTKRAVSHSNTMVSEQQKEYIKLQEKALKTTKDKKERENIKAEIKEAQFVKQTADVTVNLAKKSREQAEVKAGMVPGETSGAKTIPSVKVTEGGLPVKPKEDVKLREETKKGVDRLGQLIEVVTRIADDKEMYELIKSYVTDSGDKPSDTGLARIANQWMT